MIFTNSKNSVAVMIKWVMLILLIGIMAGSASALFLVALNWVADFRENHLYIIWFLPIGGLVIGLLYHYLGSEVTKGNNLILEEYENPKAIIPIKMAPLVLIGTLITHLFGGSAGREGTAVQMGSAIADQFTRIFKLEVLERKTILILGISAGFASVFGTPVTAGLFALEILYFSQISYKSILPSFAVAFVAYYTVEFWAVQHTSYSIPVLPHFSLMNVFWIIAASILFGLSAMLFSRSTHLWSSWFSRFIKYPPLRPCVGGIVIALAVYFIGTTKYIGLGIPAIVNSFQYPQELWAFLLKILFTSFTLGAGFKGGEVTPLFFTGAVLGSALSVFIPLPIAFLAGMGFVAVFSGATHTPLACTVMGMELFGYECGIYMAIACTVAYFCSGSVGIYRSQVVKGPKAILYQKFKNKNLEHL